MANFDGDLSFIPDESVKPKPHKKPIHVEKLNNLAGDKELCDRVRAWAGKNIAYFADQSQRDAYCKSGGIMDQADRMYRISERKYTDTEQYRNRRSNVASEIFNQVVTVITASEHVILFKDVDQLPAEYEPELNTTEYGINDGKAISEQQQMLAHHTWDEDQRGTKVKDLLTFLNKYGNYMVSVEWDRIIEKKSQRVVKTRDKSGYPTAYTFKKDLERVVKDCPTFQIHDPKDCFFDCRIDDMNAQRCLGVRRPTTYEWLLNEQAEGRLLNIGKLRPPDFAEEEIDGETVMEDRHENAGESDEVGKNGLVDVWHCWVRVPIKESDTAGKPNGKGKWDPSGTFPSLYLAMFAGDPRKKGPTLKLIKNPFFHGQIPYKFLHSHRDDKGAYHAGDAEKIKSLYWQSVTNVNQAIENVTWRNESPWKLQGSLLTRDLHTAWKANGLIKVKRGAELERVKVEDTTAQTLAMDARIEDKVFRATGANKPVLGEALGSRTSSLEAKNVFDQATAPIDERTDYFSIQLFPWMYLLDGENWRQYGDPKRVIAVTHKDMIHRVNPAELYGPIKVKVTAVSRFRNNIARRQELNSFLMGPYQYFAQLMGEQGQKVFAKEDVWPTFGFKNPNEVFPEGPEYDAQHVADMESIHILIEGAFDEPQPHENHRVHTSKHRTALIEYKQLPPDEVNPENVRLMEAHIATHENLSQQGQIAPVPGQQALLGAGEGTPTPPAAGAPAVGNLAELEMNPTEALEGALANV